MKIFSVAYQTEIKGLVFHKNSNLAYTSKQECDAAMMKMMWNLNGESFPEFTRVGTDLTFTDADDNKYHLQMITQTVL